MIILDKNKHEYKRNGIIIPGVTTVLKTVNIFDYPPFVTTGKGERYHSIMMNFIKQTLDYRKIKEEEIKFLSTFNNLIKEFFFTDAEKIIDNEIYNYAGTCDLFSDKCIGEMKTGKPEPWHKLQLAAYVWAYPDKKNGVLIYPFEKKNQVQCFKMEELKKEFKHFLCALDVYNFIQESKNA